MERKPFVRNLIVGSLSGAALGALLALAYQKWIRDAGERRPGSPVQTERRRAVAPGRVARVVMLALQLVRELIQVFQPAQ